MSWRVKSKMNIVSYMLGVGQIKKYIVEGRNNLHFIF